MTQELCRHHASEIFNELLDLPDGEAKSALEKLLNYLKQWNIFAQIWMIRKTTTYSNIFVLRNSNSTMCILLLVVKCIISLLTHIKESKWILSLHLHKLCWWYLLLSLFWDKSTASTILLATLWLLKILFSSK